MYPVFCRSRPLTIAYNATLLSSNCRRAAISWLTRSAAFSTQSAAAVHSAPAASTGSPGSPLFFVDERASPVSPWHELPLYDGGGKDSVTSVNFVLEAPRGAGGATRCRLAVARAFTPLVWEDAAAAGAAGSLTLPPLARMGFLPQTWEDPGVRDTRTGAPGDGRPLDVAEIGESGKPAVCSGTQKQLVQ